MKTPAKEQFSIPELVACARRELVQRHKVYRHLVLQGKMSDSTAQREIGLMKAIRDNLEAQTQLPLL